MREAIKYAVSYGERRIQFGQPTVNFETNQFRIADMFAGLKTSRLLIYYAANLLDMKAEAMAEAATAKLYTSEVYEKIMSDAIQVMGGDGWTHFYPVESFMRDSKVNQIGAGTSEVMRLVIYRGETRAMAKDLKLPKRKVHERLGVPISTTEQLPAKEASEKGLLEVLAENYCLNPGLFMTWTDMKERLANVADDVLTGLLTSLEQKGLAVLYKDRKGTIQMARASYKGLKEAKPFEYYKWYPEWLSKDYIF